MRVLLLLLIEASFAAGPYVVVRVTDEATGRGVPLIEIKLLNDVKYYTDSAGIIAMHEPSLEGRDVFLAVSAHGYEYPQESFLGRGLNARVTAGGRLEIKVKRKMIAERLYRLTGEGIYRDSLLAGLPVPLREPLINAGVLGQDTISGTIYRGKIYWIWGDTVGPAFYNFSVTAATSELPGKGGLDPSVGINYRYFVDREGRVKAALPLPRRGLVWIEGLFTASDPQGRERLLATYTLQQGLKPPDECGLAMFDDGADQFKAIRQYPCRKEHVASHPFKWRDGGKEYWYLYPSLRVENKWEAIQHPENWEQREVSPPPGQKRISSVAWNEYRKRFICLTENTGEVWYAEADRPEGPYGTPVKVVEHNDYNFYNVAHHPFFDQEGGRVIYFEGTYTDAFSKAKEKTPRYNYNQVMYRLRLDDARLSAAH